MFQQVALETLQGPGHSASILEVLASRAHTLLALGRISDAAATIDLARRELANVPDSSFRQLLELVILSPEGELQRRQNPAGAVATAERALSIIAKRDSRADRARLPQFELQLAKANIAWGRLPEAERALLEGIRAFEQERATIADEGRISVLDENWELFETGIQLAIKQGDFERAFALSERARARTLAEARRASEPRSLGEIRAALDPDAALIALNQFEHELAVWVIRRDEATVTMRPMSRADGTRLVSRQQQEIWSESATTVAGRALYNEIVRPLLPHLQGATRLIFVPDSTYENAAFAGLWDTKRRRHLVEDVIIAVAPSAELFVRAARPAAAVRDRQPLIIGGPAEAASVTVNAIASVYPAPTVVTGASSTSTRFFNEAANHALVHVVAETAPNQTHPLLSRLMLADEPGRRHTGSVLGRDIAARPMAATRLVVLEETKTNTALRGEGTLKLARAFMAAGVPAVVGTLPGADENAARDLMIGFHRAMAANIPPGQALATVQRNALKQNGGRLGAWTALVIYGSDR